MKRRQHWSYPRSRQQIGDRRRLTTGHDQSVEVLEVLGAAQLRHRRRRVRASRCVRARRPGGRGRQRAPRLPAAFGETLLEADVSMPFIALPRPVETLATMLASRKCVVASTMALAMRSGSSLLKMPEPTKTHFGTELQHERGVGRCRDTAGTEERHRELAGERHLLDQRQWRPMPGPSRARTVRWRRPICRSRRIWALIVRRSSNCFDDVAGAGLAPLDRMRHAPSPMRRSASAEIGRRLHTNGTVKRHLSIMISLHRPVSSTSDSSM